MSRTLGIIGPGRVGTTVAQLAAAAGWDVLVVGEPDQPSLQLLIDAQIPGARVTAMPDLAARSDVVLVAVPFEQASTVEWGELGGKVVIDVMNHWPPDARRGTADDAGSTSEVHAGFNPDVRLVKSLNHLSYHELTDDSLPPGHPGRRAVAYATDHDEAKPVIEALLDDLGFDPVGIGPLAAGRVLEPGEPLFGRDLNRARLQDAAKRARPASR